MSAYLITGCFDWLCLNIIVQFPRLRRYHILPHSPFKCIVYVQSNNGLTMSTNLFAHHLFFKVDVFLFFTYGFL